jgi:hypothetical protein
MAKNPWAGMSITTPTIGANSKALPASALSVAVGRTISVPNKNEPLFFPSCP